ncbi:hypothetical protein LMOSLCC2755_1755 [Listeria monocytogenes SLCC2755]|nr:hypothetical protein LMOSLCC2755_1755 [Listeria monocytogenes SLCC2755]CUL50005.1 hypothetical protein LM77097_110067 [Listeria monocytogenes]CUM16865.1 hypothetical protein LM901004_130067 [Listeria monocytogenes]DAL82821.1 MAG TPA: hypothetical protein [Caudoviricetes sp.]
MPERAFEQGKQTGTVPIRTPSLITKKERNKVRHTISEKFSG